ncbi:unnamed protein product [marine sediment metagenome]|uniref:Nucleotidyl transferase domain-containing protein n=1 Tax=marine sediment metagenome TaxID=412755 RepID=X1LWD8_9ZZZZ
MKVMILAAGLGTRLRPLTDLISKPMVPIVNKPVMEHIIELLEKHDLKEIIVNLHWYPEVIRDYFKDGSRFNVNIQYSYEDELLGTAGGVKKAKDFFENKTFLVISGDALTDIDLSNLIKYHKQKKSLCTMVLTNVDEPSAYGVVILNDEKRITGFQEKPPQGKEKSKLANSGIYVFEPEIFEYIPDNEFYDFGADVFPHLVKENIPIYGYTHFRYWNDVGNLIEYMKGNFDVLNDKVKVNIPGTEISKNIWIGENCKIHKDVIMSPPICIGSNCIVKKNAKLLGPLIIGNDTVIMERAILYKGIKWGSGYIGKDASLIGAVIGESTK